MSHSVADGLRISQFFEKWFKFQDGSDAYIDVFRKMKDRGAKLAKANIPIFKLVCNYFVNLAEAILEGSEKPDDKLCYTTPGYFYNNSGNFIAEYAEYDLNKIKTIKNFYSTLNCTLNDVL